ncbi:hypothetical protein BJX68DRAFT_62675 [Aspergillus pseudodeflectus]|uniref:Uncharacterized protein n=1 Tax=Aspergillus pseudodeflectus TaxID=176178 RepID=A0ABR4KJ34_9EURO
MRQLIQTSDARGRGHRLLCAAQDFCFAFVPSRFASHLASRRLPTFCHSRNPSQPLRSQNDSIAPSQSAVRSNGSLIPRPRNPFSSLIISWNRQWVASASYIFSLPLFVRIVDRPY